MKLEDAFLLLEGIVVVAVPVYSWIRRKHSILVVLPFLLGVGAAYLAEDFKEKFNFVFLGVVGLIIVSFASYNGGGGGPSDPPGMTGKKRIYDRDGNFKGYVD